MRNWLGITGLLALAAIALLWVAAPAAAGPMPQDYDPGAIMNDTDFDFATALNVTANQSQQLLFYLDCPSTPSPSSEFDYIAMWVDTGMDLDVHIEVDAAAQSSFRGHLVSPDYFRLAVRQVPPAGTNETYFNTTTRIPGLYYFVADGQATCLGGEIFYNLTWSASVTGAGDDGDNSVALASAVTNGTLVSSSLTEATDQADFIRTTISVSGSEIVLLRLTSGSGIILPGGAGGVQFEIYNTTSFLTVPPSYHGGLSPNTSAIQLIQNGLQIRESVTLTIRIWSNSFSGSYSFRVLIETYTPSDTNLDIGSARVLVEKGLDGGYLNYTYERLHFHKIFIGNARTVHIAVWSNTINIGIRLLNEESGTLNHAPRGTSRHNPVPTQVPQDLEQIHHYASASNLSSETGWYYVEVAIDDNLVPDGVYAITFYFNDGPVATNDGQTIAEDGTLTGYSIADRFTDLDCTLDAADEDCTLVLRMLTNDSTNVTWNFTGSPNLEVTPRANWFGQACADFEARDFFNVSALSRVCVTVSAVNDAPVSTGVAPAREDVPEDSNIVRLVSSWFSDIDGDTLTISASSTTNFDVTLSTVPPFVEADIAPTPNWVGCENITYTATDSALAAVSVTVDTCVQPVNDAPTVRGGLPEVPVQEDSSGTLDLSAVLISGSTGPAFSDIDGDALVYRVYDLIDVDVVVSGSLLTITPNPNFAGLGSFTVVAFDGIVESTSRPSVRVRVAPVNDDPTIDGANPSPTTVVMLEGESKTFTVTATDIDANQQLNYTWSLDGIGQTDSNDPQFTLDVPITAELARSVIVRVAVEDGNLGTVERSWTVTIQNTNLAPTVAITTPSANANFTTEEDVTFSSTASDPDGDTLTYSWTSDRVGAAIGDEQTFTARLPAGTHRIRLVVNDGTTTNEATVTITVTAPPPPPTPGMDAAGVVAALAVVAAVAVISARRRR